MSTFQKLKACLDIISVAKYYGIQLDFKNRTKCIFHQEKTASLYFSHKKQIYKCFGGQCGEGGDVVTLVAGLFKITNLEAARKLNRDFNLGLNFDENETLPKKKIYKIRKRKVTDEFNKWIENAIDTMIDYHVYLRFHCWDIYEVWENLDKLECYLNILLEHKDYDTRMNFYKNCREGVKVWAMRIHEIQQTKLYLENSKKLLKKKQK